MGEMEGNFNNTWLVYQHNAQFNPLNVLERQLNRQGKHNSWTWKVGCWIADTLSGPQYKILNMTGFGPNYKCLSHLICFFLFFPKQFFIFINLYVFPSLKYHNKCEQNWKKKHWLYTQLTFTYFLTFTFFGSGLLYYGLD